MEEQKWAESQSGVQNLIGGGHAMEVQYCRAIRHASINRNTFVLFGSAKKTATTTTFAKAERKQE
jgi:hypothetical protein